MALTKIRHINEYVTTLCATMAMLSSGAHFGWVSPTLPILKAEDSPIKITDDEGSWIVSIFFLGCVFGPLPTGFLMDRLGRKLTIMITAILFIIAWVLILLAQSVAVLYVARFLAGFSNGMTYTVLPIYLGEIASDRIRGALGTFVSVMSNVGVLIGYCLGSVPFRILPYILMLPAIILLLSYFILRETPYFHLMKHRQADALVSLKYLRNHDNLEELQEELVNIHISVKKDQANKSTIKELFITKGNRKAFFIVLGCFSAKQLCGSQAVIGYAQEIFEKAGGMLDPNHSTIVFGVVQLVIAIISSIIVDKVGRRPLLLLSSSGVTVSLAVLGGYFYMDSFGQDVSSISWLPVLCVMLYIVIYTIGLSTVPFALLCELFPTNIKAIAAVPIVMTASILGFGVTKLYQVVSDSLGTHVTFWGFSFFSLLSLTHVIFLVPETKGKSLAEIQINLNQ